MPQKQRDNRYQSLLCDICDFFLRKRGLNHRVTPRRSAGTGSRYRGNGRCESRVRGHRPSASARRC